MVKKIIITLLMMILIAPAVFAGTYNLSWDLFDRADSYVNQASTGTNYGTALTVRTTGTPLGTTSAMGSYMSIDLDIGEKSGEFDISEAWLWVFVKSVTSNAIDVGGCNDSSFSETGITYSNRDTQVAIATCTAGDILNDWDSYAGTTDEAYNRLFNVSKYINNTADAFTLKVEGASSTIQTFDFYTKENTTGGSPKLEVTFSELVDILTINIYDENNPTTLIDNATMTINGQTVDGAYYYNGVIESGTKNFILVEGNYSVRVEKTGWGYRNYYFIAEEGVNTLNTYLLNETETNVQQVTFTVTDLYGNNLEDVDFNITRVISNGSTIQIVSDRTNVAGQVVVYLDSTKSYSYILSKSGYESKSYTFVPSETAYTLSLATDEQDINYETVSIFVPKYFYVRNESIWGVVYIYNGTNITYQTDYRDNIGEPVKEATGTALTYSKMYEYIIEIKNGTDYNQSGETNIILTVYADGVVYDYSTCSPTMVELGICSAEADYNETWAFEIQYIGNYTDLFNEQDIKDTYNIIIALIIIVVTAGIGFAVKDTKITIWTFMILSTISGIIKIEFIALSVIGGVWLALNIINMVIRE